MSQQMPQLGNGLREHAEAGRSIMKHVRLNVEDAFDFITSRRKICRAPGSTGDEAVFVLQQCTATRHPARSLYFSQQTIPMSRLP